MALIPCPYCRKEISSYAKTCPHCGSDLTDTLDPTPASDINDVICPECGTHFEKNAEACPNCGEPNGLNHKASVEHQNTSIDYDKIINVIDDEFEETKMIMADYAFWGNEKMDTLSEKLCAISPNLSLAHFTEKDSCRFLLIYDERDLLHEINDAEMSDQYPQIGSSVKGMLITLDNSEKIKLDVSEENDGRTWFEIDENQFIKCCNAHSVVFKVFRSDGDSITITDTNGDSAPAVDGFRALYHFVKDRSLYIESVRHIQHWADKLNADTEKLKQENERRQADMERMEQDKGNRNITIGTIIAVVGAILFIIGITDFLELYLLVIFGQIGAFAGAAYIIFGVLKKRGYDDDAEWEKVAEILKNIKFK